MCEPTEKATVTTTISKTTLRQQAFFWLSALIAIGLFLYMFRSILLPFVAGMAIAYLLDPVADWLERRGLSRLFATITILVAFVIVVFLAVIIIIPLLIDQMADLIERLPDLVAWLQNLIMTINVTMLPDWLNDQAGNLRESSGEILREGAGLLAGLLQQIWNSGKALVDIAALFVVTPIVAFYLLLDWDRMIQKVDGWVPRDHVKTVRIIVHEMDETISGFVRGQGSLCLILGLFYATGLSLVGLNFGLLIGLFAGLISFIPYVGSMMGLLIALGVALVQFWPDPVMIAVVAGVFFAGQFIEGNILQPKLLGSSVGLHPVWLMFALFAFGSLLGFVGMLIAVPAAAMIGVLVRFGLSRYLESNLYYGHSQPPERSSDDRPQDHE